MRKVCWWPELHEWARVHVGSWPGAGSPHIAEECKRCGMRRAATALHWQLSSGGSPTADPIEPNNEGER